MRHSILAALIVLLSMSVLSAGTITDVSPDNAIPGQELWVEITGSGTLFGEGSETTVKLEIPGTETIYPTQFDATDYYTLHAYFEIDHAVTTGLYDVVVIESYPGHDIEYRLADGFEIDYPSDCGDVDGDGDVDINDAKSLILYVYEGIEVIDPLATSDINCDRKINLVDISMLIQYLFRGGAHPCAHCP